MLLKRSISYPQRSITYPRRKPAPTLAWLFVVTILAVASARAQMPNGYWSMDDGHGTRAANSSGNTDAAILVNGIQWTPGKLGTAVTSNGINQYVTVPAVDLSGAQAVTVALWVRHDYSTVGGHVLFEAPADYNLTTTGFSFFPDDDLCRGIQIGLRGNFGYVTNCYEQPSSGVWHHFAVVFDKTRSGGDEISLYVDGVAQIPTQNLQAATNTNGFARVPLYVFSQGGDTMFTAGSVDDLRIYRSALTASQIEQIYRLPVSESLAGAQAKSLAEGGGQSQAVSATHTSVDQQGLTIASGITLDGTVHGVRDNGLTASATAAVSIGTPTAADLISCEVAFASGANTLVSVADNRNGTYSAAIPAHYNADMDRWFGIYYKENVAGSPTTVTLTTSLSRVNSAISCQAWKGIATSNSLDPAFGQLQDRVAANPTTGANKTPAVNGELVIAAVGLRNAGSPTPGTNYALVDGAISTQWWPEYWVQTLATSTAGNFTWPSDHFTDVMAAFRPSGAPYLVSIAVTPANASIADGTQQQYTATGTYSDGSHQNLTGSVTWTSSATTVATINSSGLATGVAAGSTTIRATSGAISGSTGLTSDGSRAGVDSGNAGQCVDCGRDAAAVHSDGDLQ